MFISNTVNIPCIPTIIAIVSRSFVLALIFSPDHYNIGFDTINEVEAIAKSTYLHQHHGKEAQEK